LLIIKTLLLNEKECFLYCMQGQLHFRPQTSSTCFDVQDSLPDMVVNIISWDLELLGFHGFTYNGDFTLLVAGPA